MSTSSKLRHTRYLANAAEVFIEVLESYFPGGSFQEFFHSEMIRQAYWTALQKALRSYASPGKTELVSWLLRGELFAQAGTVRELLKLLLPGGAPDYAAVAARWAEVLPPGLHDGLEQEVQLVFNQIAESVHAVPDLRTVLQQLVETRGLERAAAPVPEGDDLNRLLDSALVAGPGTLPRQIRYLLTLAAEQDVTTAHSPTIGVIALAHLVDSLPPERVRQVATYIEGIDNPALRVRLLGRVAPRLYQLGLGPAPLVTLRTAFAAAGDAVSPETQVEVLLAAAPYLHNAGLDDALPSFQQRMLDSVAAIQDPASRVRALGALIPELSVERQPEAVSLAFETAARSIPNDGARAAALSMLPAHLPPEFHAPLLSIAYELRTPDARAMLLGRMLPHLPDTFHSQALNAALAAIADISGDDARAAALIALAPNVDAVGSLQNFPDALQQAIAVTFGIRDDGARARAFAALAPYLSPELLGEALQVVKALDDDDIRARTLVQLAPHLPDALTVAAYTIANEFEGYEARAMTLTVIAPYLAAQARAKALADGLAAALAIADRYNRAVALADLAPNLPAELRHRALEEAMVATRSIVDEGARARAIIFLTPHLEADHLADVLADAYTIRDACERVPVLSALLPRLPAEPRQRVAADVLDLAADTDLSASERASVLGSFAPVTPDRLLDAAISAAQAIEPAYERTHSLTALLPRRPQTLLNEALAAARAVPGSDRRVTALLELVPHTPLTSRHAILDEILETALMIADEYDRASALAKLAPYVDMQADMHHQQQDALQMALEAALSEPDPLLRARLLARLAEVWADLLGPAASYPLWQHVVVFLRTRPYREVITDLAALGPVLHMMGAKSAVEDVASMVQRWITDAEGRSG